MSPESAPPRRAALDTRRRRAIAGVVVVGALAILAWQGLGNATLYFKTADEAVAQRAKLGNHRFRIEGVVQPGTVHQAGSTVDFVIASNGVSVPVVHRGDPPHLFKEGLPVVLEGRWAGHHFASDQVLVKHTATYIARHPQRVSGYPGAPTSSP
jgi:cytochrome c-type biogenesis protein CcmE